MRGMAAVDVRVLHFLPHGSVLPGHATHLLSSQLFSAEILASGPRPARFSFSVVVEYRHPSEHVLDIDLLRVGERHSRVRVQFKLVCPAEAL